MSSDHPVPPLQRGVKRALDLVGAATGLLLALPVILLAWAAATVDTRRNGFFTQVRIGRNGVPFRIVKIRTMRDLDERWTTVTTVRDPRLTRLGLLLRRTKIDELPQLFNVLVGQMSFVGPRPDVPGFADRLEGEDRVVLRVLPGITGPASLLFRDEERLLAEQPDPEAYNRDVIFPLKVRVNHEYVTRYSLGTDFRCLWWTLTGGGPRFSESMTGRARERVRRSPRTWTEPTSD